jgi:AhpD family alkylhydroperoxidase
MKGVTMTNNETSLISSQVKELIAIGAAIACNCEPCFKFHYDKSRKLGISESDMVKAVETGKMVKEASASNILDLANKHLHLTPCEQKQSCCS